MQVGARAAAGWLARGRLIKVRRVQPPALDFVTRLWFAWACFFRVLFDGAFAARAFAVRAALPASHAASEPAATRDDDALADAEAAEARAGEARAREAVRELETKLANAEARAEQEASARAESAAEAREEGALLVLSLLQREGRLVDFLQQDVAGFDDADVGTAARVVHEGCKKALASHATLAPVRTEREGGPVEIAEGDVARVKLVGDVRGAAPFKGVLRHKGWQVVELTLPVPTAGHDARLVAPAEVEL